MGVFDNNALVLCGGNARAADINSLIGVEVDNVRKEGSWQLSTTRIIKE